jgi:hypothetical protein
MTRMNEAAKKKHIYAFSFPKKLWEKRIIMPYIILVLILFQDKKMIRYTLCTKQVYIRLFTLFLIT